MYKVASDKRQSGLHHGKPADWINGVEVLSGFDRLKQLQSSVQIIEEQIKSAAPQDKKELGLQKYVAQTEINKLRKELKREKVEKEGFAEIFCHIAKEQLSRPQYEAIARATFREIELRARAALSQVQP